MGQFLGGVRGMIAQQLIKKYHRSFRRYWIAGLSFLTIITIEGFLMYLLTDRHINAEREVVGKLAVVQGELLQRQLDQSFSVPLTLALILRHNQGRLKKTI
ncbi:hypothetical protein AM228_09170 [Planktothricoides sp. SR001]|nr:hypothetical protein AM228_09170 [Planktothricoides sp. SR001]